MNQPNATLVLGQPGFDTHSYGSSSDNFTTPRDVAVDPTSGKVFVADSSNHRVLRFASYASLSNGADAEAVLGQAGFEVEKPIPSSAADRMSNPRGLTFQSDGTLWVADSGNSRVLRFDNASEKESGDPADGVLGQPGFDESDPGLSQNQMSYPSDVAVDASGNLFVSSWENHRVLLFTNAATLPADSYATIALGQESFTENNTSNASDGMHWPEGVAVDSDGNLYVADSGNNRVLRFDDPTRKSTGYPANAVIGHPDFGLSAVQHLPGTFVYPTQVQVDADGILWVSDTSRHRVLGFPDAADAENGPLPELVIGQPEAHPDFNEYGTSNNEFDYPYGIAFDLQGRMWVADGGNHRVLAFKKTFFPEYFQSDGMIGKSLSSLKGDNIYDPSGNSQQHTQKTKKKDAKFFALVQNDGEGTDSFVIASAKSNKKIKIAVYSLTGGRVNVSAAAKIGSLATPAVHPGGALLYEIKGTPSGKYKDKKHTHPVWLQATSVVGGGTDRVNGKVKHRP